MRVGNFSLLIPQGRERDSGHVELKHDSQYTIRLINHGHRRCDAEVVVDGKTIDSFRVNGGQSVELERPTHDTGCFTFYRAESSQGAQVGAADIGRQDQGLISVVFRPEKVYERAIQKAPLGLRSGEEYTSGGIKLEDNIYRGPQHFDNEVHCTKLRSAGVTGLSGKSNQSFQTVSGLEYDQSGETTITLRLVVDDYSPRRLMPRSNQVPAPV